MIISRQLAFFAFFFTTCFSWSYNYHLKGSLYKTKEDDSMLYSYEELQDTATESKLTHKVNGFFDEKIIQIKNKAYLNKLHEVQCEEINPLPSTMFDIYEEIKSHFTKEIHSINVEGRECQCHSNEKESMVYCDVEASNPCYLKYHDEKNYTITLFVSFFNPLKKDKNPFIPSEKYFCSDLGTTTTVREFKFPREFSGQQIETSQKGRKITNLSFSASQNMFIRDDLNIEVYLMDMGTVLTINSTNNNIRAKKMDDDDLSFVETSDDTFEPRLVFNLYGHTVPGYYIDINEKERRYTMKFKDYINNIYTVRNDGKEIAYRATKYDSSHEELSTFDIFYESESKFSREILESLDFENAYLQNNKDKELIFEFHSELILIENSREERSLRNQISKEFNRFFNQTINTLRIMARRVEIDFNKVYFYAKIINTKFFHDVYVSRKGEPTVKADKTETALNLQNCEDLCSKEKCKMYYFKKEKSNQKENCLLFKRFLKKSEVDATKEDKLGIRVSYSDPYTIQEIEKKIETRMKESQWQFEAMLLDGKKTMLKSKSIPKHYSVEETNNLSKINDFNSDIIKSKSLNVSKNSLANGKFLSQGKISLSKCIDNFFNARNYMKVNKFQYNNDLNQCYLVIEAKNLLPSKSNDLYEYNPELSFNEITYPLQEDGFIGTTDSLSVCSDICLSNSTQFIKIDQKNAKTPVPFEKICQGVQYDTSSKNCYLLFNSWGKNDNIAFNVNLKSYKRKIEDSFQMIISDFSSDLKNLGKKLAYSENPFSTCIGEMNTECAYVIICIDSIKKTTFAYGNTLEMSIKSIINDTAVIKYPCSLFKNIQTASKIIVKTNSIFEKKYRSLTNGGVAGLTIGMMVVGVIIGVLVAKLVVSRF